MFLATLVLAFVVVAGGQFPLVFALFTGLLTLAISLHLEHDRLRWEWEFYTGRPLSISARFTTSLWAAITSIGGAAFAGFVALFTFPMLNECQSNIVEELLWGKNCPTFGWNLQHIDTPYRLYIAGIFFVVVFLGALYIKGRTHPNRWGTGAYRWAFFRMATILGVVYSALTYALFRQHDADFELKDLSGIYNHVVSKFDEVVYKLTVEVVQKIVDLPNVMNAIFAILISSDILQGVVVSIYIYTVARIAGPVTSK